ncbi:hypothetical protein E8E12_004715 [Didymella heteroderae]|uniref:Uncharacterized protein n=1 Tax=Didymella heteroderae TaxID=1769908 RepID=A0A9P5BYT0_9PLEO|nr:hypothetical protein E8E12_004715 [Didymella heteroderae]
MRHKTPVLLSAFAFLMVVANGLPQAPSGPLPQAGPKVKAEAQSSGEALKITLLMQAQLFAELSAWLAALNNWLRTFPAPPSALFTTTPVPGHLTAVLTPTPTASMVPATLQPGLPSVPESFTHAQPLPEIPSDLIGGEIMGTARPSGTPWLRTSEETKLHGP